MAVRPVVTTDRTEFRKRQIAERAAVLLRSRDYFGMSVDDLCAALNLNKTTFYRYFPSKEQLLFELHEWTISRMHDMAEEVLSAGGSASEKLAAIVRGHVTLQQTPGMGSLTVPQLSVFSPKHRKIVIAKRDEYEAIVRGLIDEAVRDGSFRPVDSRTQSLLLFGQLNSVQNWYRLGGALTPHDLVDIILGTVFDGLLVREKEPARAAIGGGSIPRRRRD